MSRRRGRRSPPESDCNPTVTGRRTTAMNRMGQGRAEALLQRSELRARVSRDERSGAILARRAWPYACEARGSQQDQRDGAERRPPGQQRAQHSRGRQRHASHIGAVHLVGENVQREQLGVRSTDSRQQLVGAARILQVQRSQRGQIGEGRRSVQLRRRLIAAVAIHGEHAHSPVRARS